MKSLLEFKTVTEEEKKDYKKFDALIRAGLANKSQINRIHTILDKMGEERPVFSNADREIMRNLFNKMADLITNNKQINLQARRAIREEVEVKQPSSIQITEEPVVMKDPPMVLLLKRVAFRIYPDGKTKVALYYNKLLDKHFTIPYGPGISGSIQSEEKQLTTLEALQEIVSSGESNEVWFEDDSRSVDVQTAQSLLNLYEKLSSENKIKMEEKLNDPVMFDKLEEYALEIE